MQFEIVREGRCHTCFVPLSKEEIKNKEVQCESCKKVDWASKIKDTCFICGAKLEDMSMERYLISGNCCGYCSSLSSKVAVYQVDPKTADELTVKRIKSLKND